MNIFKITTNDANETFININGVRCLIDKAPGTANGLNYYMVYCKEGRGLYTFCADITTRNNEIYSQYHSNNNALNNALICKGNAHDMDSAMYKALTNITELFKLEHGLK